MLKQFTMGRMYQWEMGAKCEYQQVIHGNMIAIQDAEDF
jgi:hypothetical protein